MATPSYKDTAATAQKRRQEALSRHHDFAPGLLQSSSNDATTVPRLSGILEPAELEIVSTEASDVLVNIRSRAWTALAVTQAFIKAACLAQQMTNCLTETMFPEAIARARQLDEHLATTGRPVGLLHGLPISLKDCFVTPPHPSSLGFTVWANKATSADDESVLVKLLRDHGAVAYCKTNTPTAMMMMETDNNVWGATLNPANLKCSAGGSSGGEGALVAMQGSPLGIGTDIGGSIRIPSAYNGLYSLKPSFSRLPTYGTRSGIPGNDFIFSVNGPMTRSLQTVQLYCSIILADGPLAPWHHDPKCIPLPWRAPAPHAQLAPPTRPLRLGFLPPHDELVTAHPPVARALVMTKRAALAAGHIVIDWSPAGHTEMLKSVVAAFLDLGGPAIGPLIEEQGREPWFTHMAGYKAAWDALSTRGEQLSGAALRAASLARNALQKAYLDRWRSGDAAGNLGGDGVPPDALVAAASPWAAIRAHATNTPREEGGCPPYFGYTAVWSLLDLPAATFPVTRARAGLDLPMKEFTPLGEIDAQIQADYDAELYDGAPVGLQVVGERLCEEKLLDVVGALRTALEALPAEEAALLYGVPVSGDHRWQSVRQALEG